MAKTIGSILVGVGLDTKQFQKDLKNLEYSLKRTATKFKGWGQDMSMAISVPIIAGAGAAIKAFADEENAIIKMNAAIKANGKNVDSLGAEYKSFAAEIQRMTVVEDDAVIAALQLAESMKLANPKEAVQGAIGLSRAFGIDLNTALKATAKGMNGQWTALQKLIPSIKLMGTDAEKAALFQDILNNSFKVAQEETTSTSGKLLQLKNNLGDLGEQFGEILAEYIKPFVDKIRDLIFKFQELNPETKKMIVNVALLAAAIGPALLIFGQLASTLGGLIGFIRTLTPALLGLTGPIAALLIAGGYIALNWKEISKNVTDFKTPLTEAKQEVKDTAKEIEKAKKESQNWEDLNWAIAQTYNTIKAAAGTFIDWYSNMLGRVTGETKEAVSLLEIAFNYGKQLAEGMIPKAKAGTIKGDKVPFVNDIVDHYEGNSGTFVPKDKIETAITNIANLENKSKGARGSLTWFNDEISKLQTKISENVLTPRGLVSAVREMVDYEAKAKKLQETIDSIKESLTRVAIKTLDQLVPSRNTLKPIGSSEKRKVPTIPIPGMDDLSVSKAQQNVTNFTNSITASMQDMVQNGLMVAAQGFTDMFAAIATGGSIGEAFNGLLLGLMDVLSQFAQVAIATGIASEGIIKALKLHPYAAIAGGIALLALTKIVKASLGNISKKAVPGYASGGIFGDESLIRVGEYPGASSNPEVVAPLDKLKDMLRLNGNGMQLSVVIDSRLQGSDLRQSIQRTETKYSRL